MLALMIFYTVFSLTQPTGWCVLRTRRECYNSCGVLSETCLDRRGNR